MCPSQYCHRMGASQWACSLEECTCGLAEEKAKRDAIILSTSHLDTPDSSAIQELLRNE